MAIFLAALAVAVVVALVVLVARRDSAAGPSGSGGRLARRVEDARAADARYVDDYVDEQAAIWDASGGNSTRGRPALFREDVGQADPRTPEAYDVSDLYVPAEPLVDEPSEPIADDTALEDLVESDYGWEYVDEDDELAADQAFAADLDEVDDESEFDRFAPRRSMTDPASGESADEFASELLGVASDPGDDQPAAAGALVGESTGGSLQRRTPKASAESYKQPLRLARTRHRPTGATRRSPDQIRSMLLNYRGGMEKGREAPPSAPDPEIS